MCGSRRTDRPYTIKYTGRFVIRFARQPQNAHAGVVVVEYTALCGLPDQFLENWAQQSRSYCHQFPLRRCRQWHPQLVFQFREPFKWHACSIFNRATIAIALASYFSVPASSGSSAVKISPQALHLSRAISNTSVEAAPVR